MAEVEHELSAKVEENTMSWRRGKEKGGRGELALVRMVSRARQEQITGEKKNKKRNGCVKGGVTEGKGEE